MVNARLRASSGGGGGSSVRGASYKDGDFPDDPNTQLGFEVSPHEVPWTFAPEFYPDRFNQKKSKELDRYADGCAGEEVSIKAIKNREFHATGVLLEGEIPVYQKLLDFDGKVDILSPLTPSGGMECIIKDGELGEQKGWDPHTRQWMFKWTLDLVSTGRDEYQRGRNAIVTAIMQDAPSN